MRAPYFATKPSNITQRSGRAMMGRPSSGFCSVACPLRRKPKEGPRGELSGLGTQLDPAGKWILSACRDNVRKTTLSLGKLMDGRKATGAPRETCSSRACRVRSKTAREAAELGLASTVATVSAVTVITLLTVLVQTVAVRSIRRPKRQTSPNMAPGVALPTTCPDLVSTSTDPSRSSSMELAGWPASVMFLFSPYVTMPADCAAMSSMTALESPARMGLHISAGATTSISQSCLFSWKARFSLSRWRKSSLIAVVASGWH
mmetsp:Transcript_30032/g.94086  ORF Transcript_30032/g.94086 Transcript_30032/m.94086 type:complete len:261 (+) Transcript_30032:885-1667(+)